VQDTSAEYKTQFFVNLIDKKGSQDRIGKKFSEVVQALKDDRVVGYEWFDFHAECKNLKFENTAKLLDKVNEKIVAMAGFRAEL
jgi:phosphatidylinositol 4-phosphatase